MDIGLILIVVTLVLALAGIFWPEPKRNTRKRFARGSGSKLDGLRLG